MSFMEFMKKMFGKKDECVGSHEQPENQNQTPAAEQQPASQLEEPAQTGQNQ